MAKLKVHKRNGQGLSGDARVWCGRANPKCHTSSDRLATCEKCVEAEVRFEDSHCESCSADLKPEELAQGEGVCAECLGEDEESDRDGIY